MAAKKKGAGLTVTVEMVPTSGTATTKTVTLEKSGASLGEVLAEAKVSAKNKDLLVNGKPATVDTHVTAGDKVGVKVNVQVSERPAGS